MGYHIKRLMMYLMVTITLSFVMVNGEDSKIQADFNQYFAKLHESFERVANSQSLRDRSLSKAENLFLREMRGNLSFNTFIRTNSKGQVISEAIRGSKIERKLRDVSSEAWFRNVKTKQDAYSVLIKDKDKGRYYLLWAQPILTAKGTFVGSVVGLIDIWDCFYDFSNNVYYPFLIKLSGMTFFDHKWKDDFIGTEDVLTIDGATKVTVTYIPEPKPVPVDSVSLLKTSPAVDSSKIKQDELLTVEKKKSPILLLLIIVALLGLVIGGSVIYGKMRHRAIQRKIDNDDF